MGMQFCVACTSVQVDTVIPVEVLLRNYFYFSSAIQTLRDHFGQLAEEMVARFVKPQSSLVVEIGCNDGVFLRHLANRGVRNVGVDPAKNVVESIKDPGVVAINDCFGTRPAKAIVAEHGKADAIVSSFSFAHIDDMQEVMRGVDALLGDKGVFVFEIYYLGVVLEETQYDMMYHEHMSYYTLACLEKFLGDYGIEIFEVKESFSLARCASTPSARPRIRTRSPRPSPGPPRGGEGQGLARREDLRGIRRKGREDQERPAGRARWDQGGGPERHRLRRLGPRHDDHELLWNRRTVPGLRRGRRAGQTRLPDARDSLPDQAVVRSRGHGEEAGVCAGVRLALHRRGEETPRRLPRPGREVHGSSARGHDYDARGLMSRRPARVLILGGTGMLGSMLWQQLSPGAGLHVRRTQRRDRTEADYYDALGPPADLERLLEEGSGTDYVLNALGLTRVDIREGDATSEAAAWAVNADLPKRLAQAAAGHGARVIHISTDGVFSGRGGPYDESSVADPRIYGRTKLEGEVADRRVLTLRCSISGTRPGEGARPARMVSRSGCRQAPRAKGFIDQLWNGVTTLRVRRAVPYGDRAGRVRRVDGGRARPPFLSQPARQQVRVAAGLCRCPWDRPRRSYPPRRDSPSTVCSDRGGIDLEELVGGAHDLRTAVAAMLTSENLLRGPLDGEENTVATRKPKLAIVLGIRPDVIRASLFLNMIRKDPRVVVTFIWSGQHYSDNLKSIFFRELEVARGDRARLRGESDAEVVGSSSQALSGAREAGAGGGGVPGRHEHDTGAIAAAQLNIPIVHIEGCMRSYDWRMPEEKYRTTSITCPTSSTPTSRSTRSRASRRHESRKKIVVVRTRSLTSSRRLLRPEPKFDRMATASSFPPAASRRGLLPHDLSPA